MADMLHITYSSALTIMHDHLNMRCICARWVLKLLMPEQKQTQVEMCWEL